MTWARQINIVRAWWAMLSLVSCANIVAWFALYERYRAQPLHDPNLAAMAKLMFLLCAGYVFGCAFRSFLPRADTQRICLVDTWLSSVAVGRTVATVAEVCFAIQWALVLWHFAGATGARLAAGIALCVAPLILLAEICSWYGVVTLRSLAHAVENSIWAVTFGLIGVGLIRLLPEVEGSVRAALGVGIAGIAAYVAFLAVIDVPMYAARWRAERSAGTHFILPRAGARDALTRWIVTHSPRDWEGELMWMALYFSVAVWSSLGLTAVYCLQW